MTDLSVREKLIQWAREDDNIRALVLNGSRADSTRAADVFSDYDVDVFVRDTQPFVECDDKWLSFYGPILVRWPLRPQVTWSADWVTQLVQFSSGERIDFQFTALATPQDSPNLKGHFEVLVDKDDACKALKRNDEAFAPSVPTAQAFQEAVNGFWWDSLYVPKCLRRGELEYGRFMLETALRQEKVLPMAAWAIQARCDAPVRIGNYGRWLSRYLTSQEKVLWAESQAGPAIEAHWQAFDRLCELFEQWSQCVAARYDFEYPAAQIQSIKAHARKMAKIML